jgi:pyruvate kinase
MEYDYRRTKIIFTIGPATESEEMLGRLIAAGVDICRINMAHAGPDWTRSIIRRVRAAAAKAGREIGIMMDVKGPEVRTGDVDAPMELNPGEIFDFTVRPEAGVESSEEVRSVDVNYRDLINDIGVGDTVLVDNGVIRMEVLEKNHSRIRCRVMIPGTLGSRRHINLPGVRVNLPALTEKDKRDALLGIEEGVDFFALSFVRDKNDIHLLRAFLKEHNSQAAIMAKIEDQQAISNLDEIIMESDCLMVARGDLGIECPYEELPIIQRRAVKTCIRVGKPVIIATHMLESMIHSPMPTRAEITDVANAVYEQGDCVMLSGETSVGAYPVECVEVLDRIARRIERSGGAGFPEGLEVTSAKAKMMRAAVVMANDLESAGLLVFTRRGYMPQVISALRPRRSPIFAFSSSVQIQRQLKLLWGVEPFFIELESDPEVTIRKALEMLKKGNHIKAGDRLVVASNFLADNRLIDSLQMRVVE